MPIAVSRELDFRLSPAVENIKRRLADDGEDSAEHLMTNCSEVIGEGEKAISSESENRSGVLRYNPRRQPMRTKRMRGLATVAYYNNLSFKSLRSSLASVLFRIF